MKWKCFCYSYPKSSCWCQRPSGRLPAPLGPGCQPSSFSFLSSLLSTENIIFLVPVFYFLCKTKGSAAPATLASPRPLSSGTHIIYGTYEPCVCVCIARRIVQKSKLRQSKATAELAKGCLLRHIRLAVALQCSSSLALWLVSYALSHISSTLFTSVFNIKLPKGTFELVSHQIILFSQISLSYLLSLLSLNILRYNYYS